MDRTKPTLSVVVIAWNQYAHVRRLVSELLDQDYERDCYEIIVVDDGSTDGTREWLSCLPNTQVKAILNEQQLGRARTRNKGISTAKNDVIVLIDGDHDVRADFLSVHAERHMEEECVVVGRSILEDMPERRALHHYLNHCGAAKLDPRARLPGRYFISGNCSIPRNLLQRVGLFDDRFDRWGGEDLDLGVRLEKTGRPLYGEPRAAAIHDHLRSLDEMLQNLFVYGMHGVSVLVEKHAELFVELNLDRSLRSPTGQSRFSLFYRVGFRLLLSMPIYLIVRQFTRTFRRCELPRLVFDYLHLRQYTRGYMSHLATEKEMRRGGGAH